MILGSFPPGFLSPLVRRRLAARRRAQRARRARLMRLARIRAIRASRLRVRGFQGADPSFIMSTGTTPPWTTRDPRAQLTNVGNMTLHQKHPDLAGLDGGLLSRFWAWLRGER